MKKNLRYALIALELFLMPVFLFGQVAPNLGTTSGFVLFNSIGAFSATEGTIATGDAGANDGARAAFPPGTLNGNFYWQDPTSAQAARDVNAGYNYMSTITILQTA